MGFDVIVNNVKQDAESLLRPGSRWGQSVGAAVYNYNITNFC